MSVWKSNFFLQTGLPESLPKPPQRDAAADEQFAADNDIHVVPTRAYGLRGKDKNGRKIRGPCLFNFFEGMRCLESREADGNVIVRPEELRVEYHALSKPQRAYWEYMQELWIVFKIQENVADWPYLPTRKRQIRKNNLLHKFYFMEDAEQQQLVRDYIAQRWEKENYQHVQETCQQDNLRHLVGIRRDLRLLLAKVENALPANTPDAEASGVGSAGL
jgi:hypothetical protein